MKKQGMPMPRFKVKRIKREMAPPDLWVLILAGILVFFAVALPLWLGGPR